MKRIIATAFVAIAALTGAAQAMTPSGTQLHDIRNYAPTADLSALTEQDVNKIIAVIQSGGSENDKRSFVLNYIK